MPLVYDVDLFAREREPLSCNNGHRRVPAWQVPESEVPLMVSESELSTIRERDRSESFEGRPWLLSPAPVRDIPLSELCAPRVRNNSLEKGYCRERRAGRWIERRITSNVQGGSNIRVLPSCVDFETGELLRPYVCVKDCQYNGDELEIDPRDIKFMQRGESRASDIRSVRASCERFKWIVRANERKVRLFLTLTYAENMWDVTRLYEDFRRFWQKLRRRFPVSGYLCACEPQKRGAWHMHILILSNSPGLYIPNRQVNRLWGHGFTKTQRVYSVRDVGSYLTSYLTNIKDGKGTKKGGRLSLYPVGFRFARWSRGVRRCSESSWRGSIGSHLSGLEHYALCFDFQNEKRLGGGFSIFSRIVLFCKEKPK